MELPIPEVVVETAKKRNEVRMQRLEVMKTEKAKDRRIALKVARAMAQEERKRWNKGRRVQHTYGDGEAGDGNEEAVGEGMEETGDNETDVDIESESSSSSDGDDEEADNLLSETALPSKIRNRAKVVSVTRKTCVCGGSDHMRRSSKKCPQYKPKQQKENK
ncbi:uncharacterized protein [Branchiostoma lanceolatum]|uniref:uncharacterized protein n=1 Tax=Branchiostoma lanceolatum TaxID=7740 RepID=UPI0034547D61